MSAYFFTISYTIEVIFALQNYGFYFTDNHIFNGLANAKWQCRLELVRMNPKVFIDGAHNVNGVESLVNFFKTRYKNKKIKFIFGVLKDKEYIKMIEKIIPLSETVFTVKPNNERALDAHELSEIINRYNVNSVPCISVKEAIVKCLSESCNESLICIFGSLYFVGEARELIIKGALNECIL